MPTHTYFRPRRPEVVAPAKPPVKTVPRETLKQKAALGTSLRVTKVLFEASRHDAIHRATLHCKLYHATGHTKPKSTASRFSAPKAESPSPDRPSQAGIPPPVPPAPVVVKCFDVSTKERRAAVTRHVRCCTLFAEHPRAVGVMDVWAEANERSPYFGCVCVAFEHIAGPSIDAAVRALLTPASASTPLPQHSQPADVLCAQLLDVTAHAHRAFGPHGGVNTAGVFITDTGLILSDPAGLEEIPAAPRPTPRLVRGAYIAAPVGLSVSPSAPPETLHAAGDITSPAPFGAVSTSTPPLRNTLSAAADVWGCGVVLYTMIAGRHPFAAETTAATAVAIRSRDPVPSLHGRSPGHGLLPAESVTEPLSSVIALCLAKDPASRPSPAQLLARLPHVGYAVALDCCDTLATEALPAEPQPEPWSDASGADSSEFSEPEEAAEGRWSFHPPPLGRAGATPLAEVCANTHAPPQCPGNQEPAPPLPTFGFSFDSKPPGSTAAGTVAGKGRRSPSPAMPPSAFSPGPSLEHHTASRRLRFSQTTESNQPSLGSATPRLSTETPESGRRSGTVGTSMSFVPLGVSPPALGEAGEMDRLVDEDAAAPPSPDPNVHINTTDPTLPPVSPVTVDLTPGRSDAVSRAGSTGSTGTVVRSPSPLDLFAADVRPDTVLGCCASTPTTSRSPSAEQPPNELSTTDIAGLLSDSSSPDVLHSAATTAVPHPNEESADASHELETKASEAALPVVDHDEDAAVGVQLAGQDAPLAVPTAVSVDRPSLPFDGASWRSDPGPALSAQPTAAGTALTAAAAVMEVSTTGTALLYESAAIIARGAQLHTDCPDTADTQAPDDAEAAPAVDPHALVAMGALVRCGVPPPAAVSVVLGVLRCPPFATSTVKDVLLLDFLGPRL